MQRFLYWQTIVLLAAGVGGVWWMGVADAAKGLGLLALGALSYRAFGGPAGPGARREGALCLGIGAAIACYLTHPGFTAGGYLASAPAEVRSAILGLAGLLTFILAIAWKRKERKASDPEPASSPQLGPWALYPVPVGAVLGAVWGALVFPADRKTGAALGALSGAGVAAAGWGAYHGVCGARDAKVLGLVAMAVLLASPLALGARWLLYRDALAAGVDLIEKGDIRGAQERFAEAQDCRRFLGAPGPMAEVQAQVSDMFEARGDLAGSEAAWKARLRTLGLPEKDDLRLMALRLRSGNEKEVWERYVRQGAATFTEPRMCATLRRLAADPKAGPKILTLAAMASLAEGRSAEAEGFLRRLLAARTDDAGGMYALESVLRDSGRAAEADALRARPHRAYVEEFVGILDAFPEIIQDFTGRLEMPAGRYRATCEVSGLEAYQGWPVLEVYLNDSLIHQTQVRRPEWHEVRLDFEVEREGSFRMRLNYPNDLYDIVNGSVINRNLRLRAMRIEALDPAGRGAGDAR